MKAINIGNSVMNMDVIERYPCWYAKLSDKVPRSHAKWAVGVKKENKEENEEYLFKVSKVGNVADNDFWTYITSKDFACNLISIFRASGKKAIIKWINSGCKDVRK